MVRRIAAIFSQGAFRPIEPLALPEGTRVQLRVEQEANETPRPAKIHTPKLAHPEEAADFMMQVRKTDDAGV